MEFFRRPGRLLHQNDPDHLVNVMLQGKSQNGRYKSVDVILRWDTVWRPFIRCIVSPKPGKHNGGTLSIIQARVASFRQESKESQQQIGFKGRVAVFSAIVVGVLISRREFVRASFVLFLNLPSCCSGFCIVIYNIVIIYNIIVIIFFAEILRTITMCFTKKDFYYMYIVFLINIYKFEIYNGVF